VSRRFGLHESRAGGYYPRARPVCRLMIRRRNRRTS
jgi:hypothetical protein